ncbi:MAG: Smr/MutS family protein, partial [Myxococcales bacterium]|nr:Smr/MutS family protein [Myxococcales bacterium]
MTPPPDDDRDGDDGAAAVPEVVELAITDELDLHHFRPADVADLVDEYLREARARGLRRVRLIHGKGTGTLRRTVHAVLGRHPDVAGFALADERAGSWG